MSVTNLILIKQQTTRTQTEVMILLPTQDNITWFAIQGEGIGLKSTIQLSHHLVVAIHPKLKKESNFCSTVLARIWSSHPLLFFLSEKMLSIGAFDFTCSSQFAPGSLQFVLDFSMLGLTCEQL